MKTFFKFALIPVLLFVSIYLIPKGFAMLINLHSDFANLILLFFVSIGFGTIATYLYYMFSSISKFSAVEATDEYQQNLKERNGRKEENL